MHTAKGTTTASRSLQMKLQQEGSNNGVGESFRVLYYGTASSVPFIWESQPGTPKHALTESSLPPLTPPPSYHHINQEYNSSMQLINRTSKRSSFLRSIFLASSRKSAAPPSYSSSCSGSSSSSSSSYLYSTHSTPMSKTEVRRMMSVVKFELEDDFGGGGGGGGGGSPTSTLCLGGGFKNGFRIKKMKKAMLSFVRHGKA